MQMILLNNQQSLQSQNWYSCPWGYATRAKHSPSAALSLSHLAHWPQSALPPITFSLLLLSQCTDSALILAPSFYLKHCNLPSPLMQFMVWLLLFSSNIIIPFCVLLSLFLFLKHSHKHQGLKKSLLFTEFITFHHFLWFSCSMSFK